MAKQHRSRRKSDRPRTRASKPPKADYDSPWKEALDAYFAACMLLFFPQVHAEIDWSRGHEALDKELQPIVRRAREVVSLAILADDDPSWRPGRYEYSRRGFRTVTEFPVFKLLDYAGQYEELDANDNPFAVVVLAHLKALETRRSPAERYTWKVRLVKGLYGRGMAREDIRRLLRFIEWVMASPAELEQQFQGEIDEFQQEKRMPFIDMFERMGLQKGLLQGIEAMLDMKFGAEGLELMPELRQIRDHVLLSKVLTRLKTAASLDDVRRVWTRKRRPKATKPE